MRRLVVIWLLICPLLLAADADRFETIKQQLAQAACTEITFISILESDVFDEVDSLSGTAYLARDGRFLVMLGPDIYLFDLDHLYSYSEENNQVVVEKVEDPNAINREISFVTKLDDMYRTEPIKPDHSYWLHKRDTVAGDTPDSMTIFLHPDTLALDRLEYLDVNEERNVIVFGRTDTRTGCNESRFEPHFPDSVEWIKL